MPYEPKKNFLKPIEYNPDGSMKLSKEWDMPEQQVPFNTPIINTLQVADNQGNSVFRDDSLDQPPKQKESDITKSRMRTGSLINVLNFGLTTLTEKNNFNKQKREEERYSQFANQPEMVYYNKRALRGDNQMYAKEGGEFDLEEKEIERLKKLGYEFDIL